MPLPSAPRASISYRLKIDGVEKDITLYSFRNKDIETLVEIATDESQRSMSEILRAVVELVSKCINPRDLEWLDLNKLPLYELEMMFLKIRMASMGKVIPQVNWKCNHQVDDVDGKSKACGQPLEFNIDLSKVKFTDGEEPQLTFILGDTPDGEMVLQLKVPTVGDTINPAATSSSPIFDCLAVGEEVMTLESGTTPQEVEDFFEELGKEVQTKIDENFLERIKHIYYKAEIVCPKCGHKHTIEYNRLTDFLG